MSKDDINNYVPSILNPRAFRKQKDELSLTQNSVVSRRSLSLRRDKEQPHRPVNIQWHSGEGNIIPLTLRTTKKTVQNVRATEKEAPLEDKVFSPNKENYQNNKNLVIENCINKKAKSKTEFGDSSLFSDLENLTAIQNHVFSPTSFGAVEVVPTFNKEIVSQSCSIVTVSSATELDDTKSSATASYDYNDRVPVVSVSFGVNDCETVNISARNSNIRKIAVSHKNNNTNVDCELIENSALSIEADLDENMNETLPNSPKNKVAVNLEIKRKIVTDDDIENPKVLILNTDAIEKLSHVIVQPPNYKLVKRQILDRNKIINSAKKFTRSHAKYGKVNSDLKQKTIDAFFVKRTSVVPKNCVDVTFTDVARKLVSEDGPDMSKKLGIADTGKCGKTRRENHGVPVKCSRISSKREGDVRSQSVKLSNPSTPAGCMSPKIKNDSIVSTSPRKNIESLQFPLSAKSKSTKTRFSPRVIPYFKIVTGTNFAVDAFSYGDIPNVKHYFLTHFHSDHYSGLKKDFNKMLFCSKISADLCVSRLGVSSKYIHIINCDETITIEGVEITAIDANHCPGAIMLTFSLPNGKSILHTGDFRASPVMESYPIFWNKDIHSIYLDTTYCNPRYDFPTQDQSLEMALYILRQKKIALEKICKKFSSVLIVCGTYTIGKEKFFLGMARRVGCSVWACPEKDRVLQVVEGRSFSHAPPQSCQLHVVPMRDLTHEKLRSYLDSLQGAFTEIVAFKPSGWENGKNSSVEKDCVTIHGIPYSEHSSFSELIRFVKFLKPKQVVPTVDISGGPKSVQKYFPCPLVCKEDLHSQSKVTDYFSIVNREQVAAVT